MRVGVITVRQDEHEAVLARTHHTPQRGSETSQWYQVATIEHIDVAITRCAEPGTVEAGQVANNMLRDFPVDYLLLVGICGAPPAEEFGLGDVLVATRFVDLRIEAVLETGVREYAATGGPAHRRVRSLIANLAGAQRLLGRWRDRVRAKRPPVDLSRGNLYGPKKWRERVRRTVLKHSHRKRPIVHAGPLLTSDRLVKNSELFRSWRSHARHVVGVEMEAAGVYWAAQGANIPLIAIRGISDIVGFKRSHAWTEYACQSAAAFAVAFIRSGLLANNSRKREDAA